MILWYLFHRVSCECRTARDDSCVFIQRGVFRHREVITIGIIVVEVCDGNLLSRIDLEQLEAEYPEVAVLRSECLSFCGLCRVRPYALVNGQRIYANTVEECLTLIRAAIERELAALRD
jgi:uncharacterized protein YuzB (UPF0349 family)